MAGFLLLFFLFLFCWFFFFFFRFFFLFAYFLVSCLPSACLLLLLRSMLLLMVVLMFILLLLGFFLEISIKVECVAFSFYQRVVNLPFNAIPITQAFRLFGVFLSLRMFFPYQSGFIVFMLLQTVSFSEIKI